MEEQPKTTSNYTVDELVEIGDQIHHSENSLILTTTSIDNKQERTFVCMRGDHKSLVNMFANALHSSSDLYELITEALCLKTLRDLKDDTKIRRF